MNRRNDPTRRVIAALCLLLALLAPSIVHAVGFVPLAGGQDGPTSFDKMYSYFWGAAGGQTPLVDDGVNWHRSLADAAAAAGRNLSVDIRHVAPFGEGPLFRFNFPGLKQAAGASLVTGQAAQKSHGGGPDRDIVRVTVNLKQAGAAAPEATVNTKGLHTTAFQNMKYSLHNLAPVGGPRLSGITITPSYRELGGTVFDGPAVRFDGDLPAGGFMSGDMPPSAINPATGRRGTLSDYRIEAMGSPLTETSLAFVGEVDGVLSELDLDAATALFADTGEFLVPMFSNADDTQPLFVTVDLVQWLTAMTFAGASIPQYLDAFRVSGGLLPAFPGFMFATGPFQFVPGTGFVTSGELFTGDVFLRAVIDGEQVSAPSTFALVGVGALAMLYRHRRREPAVAGHPKRVLTTSSCRTPGPRRRGPR